MVSLRPEQRLFSLAMPASYEALPYAEAHGADRSPPHRHRGEIVGRLGVTDEGRTDMLARRVSSVERPVKAVAT